MSVRALTRSRRKPYARTDLVKVARTARFSLARVIEKVVASRRELMRADLTPEVVPLSAEERVDSLRLALVWLQRAENETRQLRTLLERQLDYETKEAL